MFGLRDHMVRYFHSMLSLFFPPRMGNKVFRLVTHLGIVGSTLETDIKLRNMDSLEEANSNRWALHHGIRTARTNQPAVLTLHISCSLHPLATNGHYQNETWHTLKETHALFCVLHSSTPRSHKLVSALTAELYR